MFRYRPRSDYDVVSLGDVSLRLGMDERRIRTTKQFHVWEHGNECNVVRGLSQCFGLKTGTVTALVDNEVGHLTEELMLQIGVDIQFVQWLPSDGVWRSGRNGLSFTERGFGLRLPENSRTSRLNGGKVAPQLDKNH